MSNTAVITRIAEKHIVAGAKAIADLDIVTRMSDDVEIEAANILDGYDCHVAWQKAFQPALADDAELKTLTHWEDCRARKIQIVAQMVERFLATR
jgi:hypothetical protein